MTKQTQFYGNLIFLSNLRRYMRKSRSLPWPAFLTTWRGEVRERPVSTRLAPLGALGHGMPCPYIPEPYVEHGEQAQRRNGGPIVCFDRQLVSNAA